MIALDTNILAYAEQTGDKEGRHERALLLVEQFATGEHCIPVQVLGEFVNACRRKKLLGMDVAGSKIGLYAEMFETPTTLHIDLMDAAILASRFNLQYFDAVIIAVASRAGSVLLLSEDMQDGLDIAGLKIVNPFAAANDTLLADYFANAL